MYRNLGIICVLSAFLFGCAHPTVVPVEMPGDRDLNCHELKQAYNEVQRIQKEADDEQGVTPENIARAVLFWPALAGTYVNVQDAVHAAQHRALHLTHLMNRKGCHARKHVAPSHRRAQH